MTSDNLIPPSSQPAMRALPELPNEILLLIIRTCSGTTLKQLRLTSKLFAQMSEPYLWRKLVLVPNDHCILAFIKALKRSKVLRHVTKLTYDGRFGLFFNKIKDIPYDISLHYPPAERTKDLASLDRTLQGHFKPYEDMAIEVACLSKALRLLPNLKEVCVREYEDDSSRVVASPHELKVPSFYLNSCKKLRVDPVTVPWNALSGPIGRSYTKGFLTAFFSTDYRLQKLKAKSMDAKAMFGVVPTKSAAAFQQMGIFKNIMDGLRELELSFRNDTLVNTANHVEAVAQLLKAAKKLKKLTLKLTDFSTSRYHYSDEELTSDFSPLVETSNGTWLSRPLVQKLETLVLSACTCHDEELIHFLRLHSASLRRLELSNITLLGGEDRRECWVRLIKRLKTELKLASISFSGWFSNGGRQQWSVAKDTVGNERLKAKVENYVVDRRIRDCPLEAVAIKPNEGDVEKPANGEEFEGDLTWTMVYSNRYADGDWEPAVPSFGIHSGPISSHSSDAGDFTPPPGQSEADSWEELEVVDSLGYYNDAKPILPSYPGDIDIEPPKIEMIVDIGSGPASTQGWSVLSSPPIKVAQAPPPAAPAMWGGPPFLSPFIA
ncbi:hypothetical protein H2200_007329 [Cladophialophora chaetospira]|uniref:F-box domain-containing protein n=1 Tax=Cladophialophora chaetospira TaxID=386627 RepID=A0AA38X847_9EURO|nr:hypothetical protein H2200_007329 [Cladophialophora chaetospira]